MAEKNTQGTFESTEHVMEIELERLRDFKNHPYSVQMDAQMKDLIESIERYGILTPLIVRPLPDGVYEIISGHRRKFAAQKLRYRKVPSLSQAQRIKALSKEKQLNLEKMKEVMSEIKKGEIRRVEFSNEQLHKFFPRDYSAAKMKREILAILKLWRERYW